MHGLGRPEEPEDLVRDALVAMMLLYIFEYERGDVKDEYVELGLLAFCELLEVEAVDLSHLFHGEESKKLAVQNTLTQACIDGAMFIKDARRGRHYFESYFRRWAERLISEHLTDQIREASRKVIDPVVQVICWGGDWRSRVTEYKQQKAA